MERAQALANEIRQYAAAHADPKGALKFARYFAEGYDAWGMLDKNHPFFNEMYKEWLDAYQDLGLRGFLKLGEILFASGKYEEGSISIRFLESFMDRLDAKALPGIAKWYAGIVNWAQNDVLCGQILSPLLKDGKVRLEDFAGWRSSKLRFQRRAVPVAMLSLLKTNAKPATLLAFIRPMMLDKEKVVHQGLGWFLRETWKLYPRPVEAFLMEWKDQSARLIFQYATEKMSKETRERFRAAPAAAKAKTRKKK